MLQLHFRVDYPGELAAGLRPFNERVTVTVENDPGGDDGEFCDCMTEFLTEWFDGASVTPVVSFDEAE